MLFTCLQENSKLVCFDRPHSLGLKLNMNIGTISVSIPQSNPTTRYCQRLMKSLSKFMMFFLDVFLGSSNLFVICMLYLLNMGFLCGIKQWHVDGVEFYILFCKAFSLTNS